MTIYAPTIIYSFWVITALLALVMIGLSFWAGWAQFFGLKWWRTAKLGSALLGAVGIALLLIKFDADTRSILVDNRRAPLLDNFIETKSYLAAAMAKHCGGTTSAEPNLTCWDIQNINGQISSYHLDRDEPFQKIVNGNTTRILMSL